jgi:hypothetical protein
MRNIDYPTGGKLILSLKKKRLVRTELSDDGIKLHTS